MGLRVLILSVSFLPKLCGENFYNMAPPPRLEPPVNPLLATAGRDNLDLRRRVFLRANVVSHK